MVPKVFLLAGRSRGMSDRMVRGSRVCIRCPSNILDAICSWCSFVQHCAHHEPDGVRALIGLVQKAPWALRRQAQVIQQRVQA